MKKFDVLVSCQFTKQAIKVRKKFAWQKCLSNGLTLTRLVADCTKIPALETPILLLFLALEVSRCPRCLFRVLPL